MINGTVTDDGVPIVLHQIAGQTWPSLIEMGFNGDLELLEILCPFLPIRFVGRVTFLLASGQCVEEDIYLVNFSFDG
jgi:hypothetical protein